MKIQASINDPPSISADFYERCHGPDEGLINSWLCGIRQGLEDPNLAAKAKAGELPVLTWKGGIEKAIKRKDKVGAFQYLAAWQGLRGEDLNIELGTEVKMICTRFGVPVTFTGQHQKLLQAEEDDES
ncbi:MAG: hypothetical protein Q7T78_01820 [Rhodoferax sp.]|nr:hypothetical protein [Rhodoferax sp.]